jgi:excisionase family DNA binding protein
VTSALVRALVDELTRDDEALDALAERLERRLALAAPREDGWLDSRRAAEYLGMTPAALYRLTASRRIPFQQSVDGGKCWFRRRELDIWREQGER